MNSDPPHPHPLALHRLAWATDLHLNFCREAQRKAFYEAVAAEAPDAMLLGGDISDAPRLEEHLREMEDALRLPIFFVLGNHDFYHSSIREVEALARRLASGSKFIRFLPDIGTVELTPETGLAGHGGWADGRHGDYEGSAVQINDFHFIEDLTRLDRAERLRVLNRLGDEAGDWLRRVLPGALERFRRVIVLTHVPPFAEAARHEGQMSSPAFLPFFSSRASGDALHELAQRHPDRELLVLCGHTHGAGTVDVLPNLRVVTGGAIYGRPAIDRLIEP